MALNEIAQLRLDYGIDADKVRDEVLTSCLNSAYRHLERNVSATALADAIATSPTNAQKIVRADLLEAEALICIGKLVLRTGLQIRQKGVIVQEQSPNSPMGSATVTNQYLKPSELADYAQKFFFDEAKELLDIYQNTTPQGVDISTFLVNFTEPVVDEF